MKSEVMRISHELQAQKEKIKENTEKIKVNKTLPYLVSNVIEVCTVVTSLLEPTHVYWLISSVGSREFLALTSEIHAKTIFKI